MEMFRPLTLTSKASNSSDGSVAGPLTVLVRCVVSLDEEGGFLEKLRLVLGEFEAFPGTFGSAVFRQARERDVEICVVQRFAGEVEHKTWLESAAFRNWRAAVSAVTPETDHIRRDRGLEALFAASCSSDSPPRWKMAVLLLAAVYFPSLAISFRGAPLLAWMSAFTGAFVTSIAMVLLMNYVLVPALTAFFQNWFSPQKSRV